VELGFTNLLIISAVAFAAPLVLGMAPSVALPAVVLEIVLGIVIGPSVLGWAEVDEPVAALSIVGLAFLLFLAGLEIDFRQLRGRALRLAVGGFAVSFSIAVVVCAALKTVDLIDDVVFVAIVLSATSLGIVIPVLKDRGESGSTFGQLVIAGATIADFATIILLSLLFSRDSRSTTATLILLGLLALAVVAVGLAIARAAHLRPL
jgi:Kef-type K+ transport system membrane component KefB